MNLFASNGYSALPDVHPDFGDLQILEADLLKAVGGRQRFEEKLRGFFRSAIDEVIDTARTGRFYFNDLEKTEKTYLGTKFEILLRDWLQVPKGVRLDLLIGGREVDVKSTTGGGFGWMIPPEAIDQFCILLRVNEDVFRCSVGLVRARSDYLRTGINRDQKTSISASGRANIWWMVSDFDYTPNFWSRISRNQRDAIMTSGKGTRRLAALFENCIGIPISRVQVAAVAAQDDYMKRIRRNGGARDILAPKRIAIFYSENDRALMRQFGITFGYREFVSYMPKDAGEEALLRSEGHID
ncbi:Type-2 restriction enzyme NaeI [Sphingomonas paucimobilis]|nr:Type-2 restriction enzyme NaeI [Sphingomonas paucimobilis]